MKAEIVICPNCEALQRADQNNPYNSQYAHCKNCDTDITQSDYNPVNCLILPIKKKWFDMICSGEKLEEYREFSTFYQNRLYKPNSNIFKKFDYLILTNGYGWKVPNAAFELKEITIGRGREEWGAEASKVYFKLQIGKQVIFNP